jgi:hypothetical protein
MKDILRFLFCALMIFRIFNSAYTQYKLKLIPLILRNGRIFFINGQIKNTIFNKTLKFKHVKINKFRKT